MYKNKHAILIGFFIISVTLLALLYKNNKNNEGFKMFDNIKSNYRKKKRKAKMIKDGFIGNVQHKIKKFVRVNGL